MGEMQINLTGFLNAKNARLFQAELWDLLCSAQENDAGIPTQFLEQKKEEIKKRQAEQERVNAALRRKEEQIKEQLSREREKSDKRDRSPDRKKNRSRSPEKERDKERDRDR